MRVTYDAETDMGYIYLVDEIGPGEAVRQELTEDGSVILDFDAQGRLLGVELSGAKSRLHPDLMAMAEKSG
ncbi:DUF2283 domain-containing protein [Streptomyces sp. NPDC097640]|uniref:DUF2283 domain-containing protein n=1 Tax=Streptomyces sp. NPDC097640 TaxID=3157229 RepID=UPI00333426C7